MEISIKIVPPKKMLPGAFDQMRIGNAKIVSKFRSCACKISPGDHVRVTPDELIFFLIPRISHRCFLLIAQLFALCNHACHTAWHQRPGIQTRLPCPVRAAGAPPPNSHAPGRISRRILPSAGSSRRYCSSPSCLAFSTRCRI